MPRLLYVEDNEMNRDMLSRRLQRRGFEVLIAGDGEQGVTLAAAEARSHLDGYELAGSGRLGSHAADQGSADTRRIPIIGLTAHAMATDRDKCLEAGCDDYDTKPVELGRLLEKIERLLGTAA